MPCKNEGLLLRGEFFRGRDLTRVVVTHLGGISPLCDIIKKPAINQGMAKPINTSHKVADPSHVNTDCKQADGLTLCR